MAIKKSRLPVPQYSYRQTLKKEDRKVYRRIALIITAFFVILLIIWFMGTSFLNMLSFLSNGNTNNTSTITSSQDLPLLAPKIDKLPDAINTPTITISGSTTANVTVNLLVNTKQTATTTADEQGYFKFDKVKLTDGLNLLKVVATNKAGEKQETSLTITLDTIKPNLTLTNPVDGSSFPSSTKTIVVSGITEPESTVHVSGNQAVVNASGNFSYNLPVTARANAIQIDSVDAAGNTTIVKLNITVEGSSPPDGPQP
jgi:bacillopeptidase F